MYIYALKLKNNKYYVGRTDNVEQRINQHISEKGSSWTSIYPFEEVLFIKESTSCFDEEKYTKELMMQYGIDNVRGANYSTLILDPIVKKNLQKEIWGAKNLCVRCGHDGHFVNECKKRIDVNGNKIIKYKKPKICGKCDRKGHTTSKCLATTKLDGTPVVSPCKKCGKLGHKKADCALK